MATQRSGNHVVEIDLTTTKKELKVNEDTHKEKCTDSPLKKWLKEELKEMCTRNFFERKIPICKWLPKYTKDDLVHDILAGLTVGLTAIPQGIAYAVVAGLPAQYGLYSGFMGAFMYMFVGSCKDLTIGPTAIMALMTQSFVENHGPDYAVLLCFLVGIIILILGLLRMGFLVDFISLPVTIGFTSAAAFTIASSQVKGLLGIGGKANSFLDSWINTFEHIEETKLWDTVLGVSTIIVLLLTRKLRDFGSASRNAEASLLRRIFNKSLWLISLGRNAIVVVAGMVIAYLFWINDSTPFNLTGNIEEGFPPFKAPPFSTIQNGTYIAFPKMVTELGTALFLVPLIAILESIAIAKSFAKGKAVDATQELIALGLCNIAGSFVRSMPITGSFTRTAVNNSSGVRTPLGGLFTGAIVLLALGLLTSTFFFIPKASLAGLIICAMFFMVEFEIVPLLWRTKKLDLIPLAVTFFGCLFLSLDYGMLIGIGVNLIFILFTSARPDVHIQRITVQSTDVLLIRPDHGLVYPAAEYMRELVMKTCCFETQSLPKVIIDGTHIHSIDSTVAKNLKLLVGDLTLRQQDLVMWNWRHNVVMACEGLDKEMGKYFRYSDSLNQLLQTESDDKEQDGHVFDENNAYLNSREEQ